MTSDMTVSTDPAGKWQRLNLLHHHDYIIHNDSAKIRGLLQKTAKPINAKVNDANQNVFFVTLSRDISKLIRYNKKNHGRKTVHYCPAPRGCGLFMSWTPPAALQVQKHFRHTVTLASWLSSSVFRKRSEHTEYGFLPFSHTEVRAGWRKMLFFMI